MGCSGSSEKIQPNDLSLYINPDVAFGGAGSKYKLWGPGVDGEAIACFKDGLLYRVVRGDNWSFYNDTQEYEMHVQVRFGKESKLSVLGRTVEKKEPEGGVVLSSVVYPAETVPFMEGTFDVYKCSMSAKPLSLEYRVRKVEETAARINQTLVAIKSACPESEHKGNMEKVLAAALSKRVSYIDQTFMPLQSSLSREGVDVREIPLIPWMRPREYLPKSLQPKIVISRYISPSDTDQGLLGDCWLLCAIAAVAERPSLIERLFAHPRDLTTRAAENELGAYRVTLNTGGWWVPGIIDDYLPAIGLKPVFAKTKSDPAELWVSLLEKAYAKLHGSYATITGGDAMFGMQDLTGFPTNRFDSEWAEAKQSKAKSAEMFRRIVHYLGEGNAVSFSTPGSNSEMFSDLATKKAAEERYRGIGLELGNAYSVVDAREFPEHDVRLCKIRNYWGNSSDWSGPWGESSPQWGAHQDVAIELEYRGAEDGTFWMEWEDVKRYFDGGGVCFTRPEWYDYRVKGSFNGLVPSVVAEITVTRPVRMMLILSQRDKRGLTPTDPNSKYSAIMLSVSRNEPDGRQVVHLNSCNDIETPTDKYTFSFARDHAMAYTFEPQYSPYLIIPRIYNSDNPNKGFVLGLLSEAPANAGFTCNLKTLEGSCKVFENFPKFQYNSRNAQVVEANIQYMPIRSALMTTFDSTIDIPDRR